MQVSEDAGIRGQLVSNVVEKLKKVIDPEMHVNIYDLGLIYNIDINEEHDCLITMTLTCPTCPASGLIMMETEFAARSVKGINKVHVNLTFDPPWNPDNISEETKLELGIYY